jgi:hypothetical protein
MYPLAPFENRLVVLAWRFPRLAFALAQAYGVLRYRFKHPESLTNAERKATWVRLTGSDDLRQIGRLRMRRCGRLQQRRVLEHVLASGHYESLLPLVRWNHAERIRDPLDAGEGVIAVTWHTGPFAALGMGLTTIQPPVTYLLSWDVELSPDSGLELLKVSEGKGGAAAFGKCVSRLRKGGIVGMTGDAFSADAASIEVRLLNSTFRLGRGFAALSRASRARVVPVDVQWSKGGDLVFTAHPALPTTLTSPDDPDAFEKGAVQEFAAETDSHLQAHIEDVDSMILECLLLGIRAEQKLQKRNRIRTDPKSGRPQGDRPCS